MKYLLQKYMPKLSKNGKIKIGYIAEKYSTYNRVMPSTRIRVYEIIDAFRKNQKFDVELYRKNQNYNIIIFQKYFNENAYRKAVLHKKKGTKIILDINVNYYDKSINKIQKKQHENIIKFTKLCDAAITSSKYLKLYIKTLFPNICVFLIEENINKKYFVKTKKNYRKIQNFIWSGFSIKAKEILQINDILEKLHEKYKIKIIIISEKNPHLKIGNIPIFYKKYKQRKIVNMLLEGDIFIAPRNINKKYNLGHSFTKIGVAMAVGLPVIASPIPSYINSPAIICNSKTEWQNNLENIINQKINLENLSEKGINYCMQNFDIELIKIKYEKLFSKFYG